MSHAYGEVIKDNKVVGHFEFSCVVDVVFCNKIRDSKEIVSEYWRTRDTSVPWHECTCGKEPDEVILYIPEDACYWNAKVCLSCQLIISGFAPDYQTENDFKGNPLGDINRKIVEDEI
jgi:hypothetical protein